MHTNFTLIILHFASQLSSSVLKGLLQIVTTSSRGESQHVSTSLSSSVEDSCYSSRFSALLSCNSFSSSWEKPFWLTSRQPLGLKCVPQNSGHNTSSQTSSCISRAQYPAQSSAEKGRSVCRATVWCLGMTSRAVCSFCSFQISKTLHME